MSSPGEITLVAAGPLTNVAAAIMKEPQIVKNVKRIVIMGGTTLPRVDDTSYVPGTSRVAEFNIFTDPEAASIVFGSGAEITMVGLNVTVKLFLTPDLLKQISQLKNRATHLLEPLLAHTSLTPLWDTMTMSISIEPYLVTTQRSHVQVVLGGNDRGRTLISEDKNGNVDVSLDVDSGRLQGLILELLGKYGMATTQSVVTSSSHATESTPAAPSSTAFQVSGAVVLAPGLAVLVSLCFLVGMIFFARHRRRRATISPRTGLICQRCGVQNKLGAAFCRACGVSLPSGMRSICSSCRTTNKATSSFCRRCGTRLR
jgi:ribosomal protein L40E